MLHFAVLTVNAIRPGHNETRDFIAAEKQIVSTN